MNGPVLGAKQPNWTVHTRKSYAATMIHPTVGKPTKTGAIALNAPSSTKAGYLGSVALPYRAAHVLKWQCSSRDVVVSSAGVRIQGAAADNRERWHRRRGRDHLRRARRTWWRESCIWWRQRQFKTQYHCRSSAYHIQIAVPLGVVLIVCDGLGRHTAAFKEERFKPSERERAKRKQTAHRPRTTRVERCILA